MSAERWERLRADLAARGVEVRVTERQYAQTVRVGGRNHDERGTSRSITIRAADGGIVEISDQHDPRSRSWLGWVVSRDDADSIVVSETRRLKNRRAVCATVAVELERAGGVR